MSTGRCRRFGVATATLGDSGVEIDGLATEAGMATENSPGAG